MRVVRRGGKGAARSPPRREYEHMVYLTYSARSGMDTAVTATARASPALTRSGMGGALVRLRLLALPISGPLLSVEVYASTACKWQLLLALEDEQSVNEPSRA